MYRSISTRDVPDTLNALLGALLFLSPWLLDFAGNTNAAWNAHIFGAIIFALAIVEVFAFKMWEEWISLAVGIWLLFAPWILGFGGIPAAVGTHIIAGLATILLATWSMNDHGSGRLA